MMLYCNLVFLSVFCTFAVDITGGVDGIYSFVVNTIFGLKKEKKCPKPFGCSVCSGFWSGLIYLLIINELTIMNLAICIAIATIVPQITMLIYNILQKIINKLI